MSKEQITRHFIIMYGESNNKFFSLEDANNKVLSQFEGMNAVKYPVAYIYELKAAYYRKTEVAQSAVIDTPPTISDIRDNLQIDAEMPEFQVLEPIYAQRDDPDVGEEDTLDPRARTRLMINR